MVITLFEPKIYLGARKPCIFQRNAKFPLAVIQKTAAEMVIRAMRE